MRRYPCCFRVLSARWQAGSIKSYLPSEWQAHRGSYRVIPATEPPSLVSLLNCVQKMALGGIADS